MQKKKNVNRSRYRKEEKKPESKKIYLVML